MSIANMVRRLLGIKREPAEILMERRCWFCDWEGTVRVEGRAEKGWCPGCGLYIMGWGHSMFDPNWYPYVEQRERAAELAAVPPLELVGDTK